MQEAAFFNWARASGAAHRGIQLRGAADAASDTGAALAVEEWRGQVRDGIGVGVLATNLGDANAVGFAGFGHGVVAAVEIFALL